MTRYIVRASPRQAARWEAIAKYQGHRTVGSWLATLATERVRQIGKLVPHRPLAWHRGIFAAITMDLKAVPAGPVARRVSGWIADVFGVYGDPGAGCFALVHVPTGRQLCALPRLKDCKAVAQRLAALRKVDWEATDPEKVMGSDGPTAGAIIAEARRSAGVQGPCPAP